MKLVKSLLLGSAAGLAATTSGQAADLPFRKAAPVEYVRVCDWTGAGYFYIPGTDTCLQIGGFARAEYEFNSGGKAFIPGTPGATNASNAKTNGTLISGRNRDESGFFARGRLQADARTQTAYGTLRTFVRFELTRTGGAETFGGNPAGSGSGASLDKAFVQFAGISAGRVQSFFDFGADPYGFEGVATSDASTQALAYTQTFGGGFSASLSIEDPTVRQQGIQNTRLTAGSATTGVAYSGSRIPDVIGQLHVEQTWGMAQLSAAYHQINVSSAAPAAPTVFQNGKDDDGFAVSGGVEFNLPMFAAGDVIHLEGGYQNGAQSYTDSNGISGGYNQNPTVGGLFHPNRDAIAVANVAGTGFTLAKSEGYSVSGGLVHFFTPTFQNIVFGSYQDVDYGSRAKSISWLNGGLGSATSYRIADQVNWFPVKGLQIGMEVMYIKVDQKVPGLTTTGAAALPAGIKVNPETFETRLRVERDF